MYFISDCDFVWVLFGLTACRKSCPFNLLRLTPSGRNNWDCATLGHWSPANCKSRFQIISPHSAGSVCRFWHCQSSDPPVHPLITGYHLGFHFAGLNPISLVGLSGWPGEGRYPKHINWSLGFPRDRFLDPSSSPHTLHHWLPSYRHMASTISMLMTHSSISHFDQMIQR